MLFASLTSCCVIRTFFRHKRRWVKAAWIFGVSFVMGGVALGVGYNTMQHEVFAHCHALELVPSTTMVWDPLPPDCVAFTAAIFAQETEKG